MKNVKVTSWQNCVKMLTVGVVVLALLAITLCTTMPVNAVDTIQYIGGNGESDQEMYEQFMYACEKSYKAAYSVSSRRYVIIMQSDWVIPEKISCNGYYIEWDLNGFTVTNNYGIDFYYQSYSIGYGNSIKIKDSSSAGTGKIINQVEDATSAISVTGLSGMSSGSFVIESVTFISNNQTPLFNVETDIFSNAGVKISVPKDTVIVKGGDFYGEMPEITEIDEDPITPEEPETPDVGGDDEGEVNPDDEGDDNIADDDTEIETPPTTDEQQPDTELPDEKPDDDKPWILWAIGGGAVVALTLVGVTAGVVVARRRRK